MIKKKNEIVVHEPRLDTCQVLVPGKIPKECLAICCSCGWKKPLRGRARPANLIAAHFREILRETTNLSMREIHLSFTPDPLDKI